MAGFLERPGSGAEPCSQTCLIATSSRYGLPAYNRCAKPENISTHAGFPVSARNIHAGRMCLSRGSWNNRSTALLCGARIMPRIIPTFDQYPTFCNTPYTLRTELTKRLGLIIMVKGHKLLLMYRQGFSILVLLLCLPRFV